MAPPTRAHSSTLKQGTLALAFGAAKRTSSAPGGKAGPAPTPPTPAPRKRAAPATDDEDDITIVSSDEPDEAITPPPPKRRRTVARKPAATPASTPSPAPHPIRVDGQKVQAVPALAPVPASELPARAKLETGAKRYAAYYASLAEKTGGIPPVNGQTQTPVHHILRIFDLSYEYGPCVGVSRLQRWERAKALGLAPPPEVYDILMTEEGTSNPEFAQSVYNGLV